MSIFDAAQSDPYFELRRSMLKEQLRNRGIRDERVLDAMLRIPRHEFVSEEYKSQAYEDHPIPIGESQTISQPFIVAVVIASAAIARNRIGARGWYWHRISDSFTSGTRAGSLLD